MFENMSLCSAYRSSHLMSFNLFLLIFLFTFKNRPFDVAVIQCGEYHGYLTLENQMHSILQYFLSTVNRYLIWSNLLIIAVVLP
jgi:hypothetical protein